MRLALFGGTFNPIHMCHLLIAEAAREKYRLDRIIFVLAGLPPHKKAPRTSAARRLAMLRLAVRKNPTFLVSDWEIRQKRVVYSYETVEHFRARFPQASLLFPDQWLRIRSRTCRAGASPSALERAMCRFHHRWRPRRVKNSRGAQAAGSARAVRATAFAASVIREARASRDVDSLPSAAARRAIHPSAPPLPRRRMKFERFILISCASLSVLTMGLTWSSPDRRVRFIEGRALSGALSSARTTRTIPAIPTR